MKFNSLKSKFGIVAALATLGAMGVSNLAIAQPDAAPAKTKRGRKAKGGMTVKALAKIEETLGKPLTAEQKTQLNVAANTRKAAVKAANDAFDDEVVRITGLPIEKVRASKKKEAKPAA